MTRAALEDVTGEDFGRFVPLLSLPVPLTIDVMFGGVEGRGINDGVNFPVGLTGRSDITHAKHNFDAQFPAILFPNTV